MKVIKVNGKIVQVVSERGNRAERSTYDFLILAVPPTVWGPPNFELINWQLPQQRQEEQTAVKFLATVGSRYWVPKGFAPSGDDDSLGQLWESTDNQNGDRNIGLSVYSGGQYAELVGKNPPAKYFKDGIEKLLPGANDKVNGLLPRARVRRLAEREAYKDRLCCAGAGPGNRGAARDAGRAQRTNLSRG